MKSVQVGISEWLISVLLSKLIKGWSVLYSLPTESLRNTFVANRIDTLTKTVPLYRYGLKRSKGEADSTGLKHIFKGSVWFVGSNSKVGFVERPADMVIVDELDTSNQKSLELAPDRLKASKYKYFWNVGNPSIPKYGIDKLYRESDQKVWKIKCPACNKWQALDFFKNVARETSENVWDLRDKDYKVLCCKCLSPVDRLQAGEWVARKPDRLLSGYHISQLFSPTVTIKEIYDQFVKGQTNATKMQVFYNSYLGLPFEGSGSKLTANTLESKCMDDYLMPASAKDCTAGIDVNYPQLNIRISDYQDNKRRAVYIGTVNSFAELTNLFKQYNVKYAVIDIAPERHKIAEYQLSHAFLWTCQYNPGSSAPDEIETVLVKSEKAARVGSVKKITIDRTIAIDAMIADILQGNNRLPKNFKSIDNGQYLEQLEAPTRILDETKNPPRYIWDEGGNPDHYFHCEVYDYMAMRIKNTIGDMMPRVTTVCV
jgi:hypothetical protein